MSTQRTAQPEKLLSQLRMPPAVYSRQIDHLGFKVAVDPDAACGEYGQPCDPISKGYVENEVQHNLALVRLMCQLVKPNDVVLDLGAHIGSFALPAAAAGCRVYAFEASPRNAALLRESAAQNEWLDRLMVIQAALSNRTAELSFTPHGPWGCVTNTKSGFSDAIAVPAARLDDLLAREGCDRVDLVKMDIEGSEVAALEGAQRLLHRTHAPILYESNYIGLDFYEKTPADLRAAFLKSGYKHHYWIRGERIIAVGPHALQPEVVGEYLASKAPLRLKDWAIEDRVEQTEVIEAIVANQQSPDYRFRYHIGLALRAAPRELLAAPSIQSFLQSLYEDPSEKVRKSVAWWKQAPKPSFMRRMIGRTCGK